MNKNNDNVLFFWKESFIVCQAFVVPDKVFNDINLVVWVELFLPDIKKKNCTGIGGVFIVFSRFVTKYPPSANNFFFGSVGAIYGYIGALRLYNEWNDYRNLIMGHKPLIEFRFCARTHNRIPL